MKGLMIGATLAVLLAVPVFAQFPGAPQQDIRGWRGTEWGMSPEQVSQMTGLTLGGAEFRDTKEGPSVTCRRGAEVEVGNWTATTRFCFSELGRRGLLSISLDFGDLVEFGDLRDELAAKYGLPLSETMASTQKGASEAPRARWFLPSTEITCQVRSVKPGPALILTYAQRVATGL
jgi:hypothetical protein